MDRAPQEENRILFCPNCGYNPKENDYLNLHSRREVHSLDIRPEPEKFVCSRCHYAGSLFSIPESERYKLEFDLDEIDAPVRHAQKGSSRFYLYAVGFIAIAGLMVYTANIVLSAALTIALAGLIFYFELRARSIG